MIAGKFVNEEKTTTKETNKKKLGSKEEENKDLKVLPKLLVMMQRVEREALAVWSGPARPTAQASSSICWLLDISTARG